ncbi:MAG: alpha/beta hydrolase-fold protein, partial [Anaerolineaceae bacterium]|nr:alpha/beta hydrolase-fold protein [Anaerolineaceae bacterium]
MTFIQFLRALLRILTQAGLAIMLASASIALLAAACTPLAGEAAPPAPPPPIQPTPGLTEPSAPSPTVPPAAPPTPAPCLQSEPTIVRSQVETRVLTKPLTVSVYLPPCFDSQPQEAYPVLYLLHGQSSDDRLWQRLGALHAADQLILSGETHPFLIVMPY